MSVFDEGPKEIILRVREGGRTLLEIDEHGEVVTIGETVEIQSTVPERIISAAAGGMDVTNLPPGLKVVLADDVELLDWGETGTEGRWVKLGLPAGGLRDLRASQPAQVAHRLKIMASTWRAVIYEADLVHREEE